MISEKNTTEAIVRSWRHYTNRSIMDGERVFSRLMRKLETRRVFPWVYYEITRRHTDNDVLYMMRVTDKKHLLAGKCPMCWYVLINGERGHYVVEEYKAMSKYGVPVPYYLLYPPKVFERYAQAVESGHSGEEAVIDFFTCNGSCDHINFNYNNKPCRVCLFSDGIGIATYMSDGCWLLKHFIPNGCEPSEEEKEMLNVAKVKM